MARRDFSGKVILITGAAGGLGAALCHRFAAAGARIAAEVLLSALNQSMDSFDQAPAATVVELSLVLGASRQDVLDELLAIACAEVVPRVV